MKNCIKILGIIGIITTLSMQTVSAQNDRVNLQQHIKNVYPNGIPKKIIIEPEVKIFEKYKNSDASESAVAYTITIEEAEIKSGKIGEVVFSQPAVGDFIVTYPDSSTAFIKCNNHGLAEEVNKVMRYDRTIDGETIYFDQEKLSYDNSLNLKLRHTTIAPYDGQYNELPRFSYNNGCITDCYVDSDGPYITKFCYNTNDITKTKNTFCEEVSEKQFKEFYADKFWKEYTNTNPYQEYDNNGFIILEDGKDIYLALAGLLGNPNRKLPIATYSHYHGGDHSETRKIFKWTLNEKGFPVKCEVHEYEYSYEYGNGKGTTLSSIKYQTTKYIYD